VEEEVVMVQLDQVMLQQEVVLGDLEHQHKKFQKEY
jgi:hypothetical protein